MYRGRSVLLRVGSTCGGVRLLLPILPPLLLLHALRYAPSPHWHRPPEHSGTVSNVGDKRSQWGPTLETVEWNLKHSTIYHSTKYHMPYYYFADVVLVVIAP